MNRAKILIEELIEKKSGGDVFVKSKVRLKLLLKGIMLDKIDNDVGNSTELIDKIYEVAKDFDITLNS